MPGPGSRSSMSAPQRMQRMWIRLVHRPDLISRKDVLRTAPDYDRPVIPAIVLAAGRSSRMGRAKATLPLGDGDTFLTRIVRTFRDAGIDDVIVVVGHEADAIASELRAERARGALRRQPRIRSRPAFVASRGTRRDRSSGRCRRARHARRRAARRRRRRCARWSSATAPRARRSCGRRRASATGIRCSSIGRFSTRCAAGDPTPGRSRSCARTPPSAGDLVVDDEGAFIDIDTEEDYRNWITSRSTGASDRRSSE